MKKIIKLFSAAAVITSLLFLSASCKKSADGPPANNNTAVIKLNGAQPTLDSVTATVHANGSTITAMYITAYLNHSKSTVVEIQLYISPSDPLYATGAVLDFATTHFAEVMYRNTSTYYDDYMHPNHGGLITITKNDVAARRIEGTLSNCVVTGSSNGVSSISIDGSFAVTYPAGQ